MKTRNLKLLATLTIVVIALGLAVVGLVVLISHEEDPNPTSILTMTVDQVLVAANAGQLDTFDKIMAARTAIDKNRPPTPAVLTEDRTTIETAIAEYHDAEERYGTESIEAFAEAMVGTEVRDWVGWVVFVEGGKADGGATIGVYMTDPYATQRAPRPRPWVIYTDPTMPDVYIGATEEDARIVVAGDLITFSGTIKRLDLYPAWVTVTATEIKRPESEKATAPAAQTELQGLVVTLQRIPGGYAPDPDYDYKLTIYGDGRVIYEEGVVYGTTRRKEESKIGEAAVRQIISESGKADFFRLEGNYPPDALHSNSATISITVGGKQKTVKHDQSSEHPDGRKLHILETRIDEIVDSARWVK